MAAHFSLDGEIGLVAFFVTGGTSARSGAFRRLPPLVDITRTEVVMVKSIRAGMVAAAIIMAISGPALAMGAIAVRDGVGLSADQVGFGFVVGAEDKKEAERGALQACREQGIDGCSVAVFFDRCGAYAASKLHAGIGSGRAEDIARRQALDDCGSTHCRIVVSQCEK